MWPVCKKEIRQYFTSLTGYLAIIAFLLLNGLVLFVLPDNILDTGFATLERYFQLAPWILLVLIPSITMRSFAEEFRTGTFEILHTMPITKWQLLGGKYLGALIVVAIAIVPTIIYAISIQNLSASGGLDTGATTGSFIGLLLLAAAFTAIGIMCSSATSNTVVAFILSALACIAIYGMFAAISQIPAFESGADYYLQMIGIDYHYQSISRGVVDSRDLIYFFSLIFLFLFITNRNLVRR
jgi:ABC-2 type transport system permease protein